MKLFKFLRLIRVHQWIKNVFVFVPLLFSLHLFDKDYFETTLLAFLVFCLASSAIYVINDLVDIESDRAHPVKKDRPLPSGAISQTAAMITASILLILVFWLMMYFNTEFILLVVAFVVLNVLYSFWLKNLVLLDIFSIAAGFMIRVLAGAFAIQVPISSWLLLSTVFTVHALDVEAVPLGRRFTGAEVRKAIEGHVLASASITGTYTLNPRLGGQEE